MTTVTLLCSIGTNKKGRFELTPHTNLVRNYYFGKPSYDVGSLGDYFKVRSDAVQKMVLDLNFKPEHYTEFVVAVFNEKTNLVLKELLPIVKGKEPKMTTASEFVINIKSVSYPTPQAIRKELEAVEAVKVLYVLTNIAYAAVNQTKQAHRIPFKMEEGLAINIATILGTNGAVAEVVNDTTGAVVFTSAVAGASVSAPAAKAEKKPVEAKVDPDYFYVPECLRHISSAVYAMAQSPLFEAVSILISGPSGFGKTAFARPLAKALGYKVGTYDMSLLVDTEDFFGGRQIENGSTVFKFNQFVADVEEGGHVIVLDETNRTIPSALNAALGLLDWRREAIVHGRKIRVGKNTIFVATRNVGSEYAGTHATDVAFASRFDFSAIIDSIPVAEEVKLLTIRTGVSQEEAARIVKVANFLREQPELGVNCSPRNTLAIAGMAAAGIHVRAAFQWNLLMKIEDSTVRVQVETMLNRQLGVEYGPAASTLKNIF